METVRGDIYAIYASKNCYAFLHVSDHFSGVFCKIFVYYGIPDGVTYDMSHSNVIHVTPASDIWEISCDIYGWYMALMFDVYKKCVALVKVKFRMRSLTLLTKCSSQLFPTINPPIVGDPEDVILMDGIAAHLYKISTACWGEYQCSNLIHCSAISIE